MNDAQRDLQHERQQRGDDFQNEIRKSWRLVNNCWRMTIESGKGTGRGSGTRPADAITLLKDVNILTELKRTAGNEFKLSMLRPGQLKGLMDFDAVIPRNFGLVFISFLNEAKGIDEAYSFRIKDGLDFMRKAGRWHIKREEIPDMYSVFGLPLPRLPGDDERLYDLEGVNYYYSNYA